MGSKEYFEDVAERWDEMRWEFFSKEVREKAYEMAQIEEDTRILKTDGKLVITDLDKHDNEFLRKEQNDRWLGFEREDIKRWFTHAGLQDIRVESVGTECCSSSTCDDQDTEISIFAAVGEAE